MTPINTVPDVAQFLESLKAGEEGLDKHPEWDFKRDLEILYFSFKNLGGLGEEAIEYLFERCRRAESNAKPSDLVEKVKACIRFAVNSRQDVMYEENEKRVPEGAWTTAMQINDELRKLTEAAK
jgi:hypothetical protein